MTFKAILYETRGPLAIISLNRPQKLNAISTGMLQDLNRAMDLADADDAVKVIILWGEGKCFSAGFDLNSDDETDAEISRTLHNDFSLIMRFWDSEKPTIAAVHTYCLGGAMELAMACDLTIAADGCRFGAPEVKFGSGIVALLLPWLIGPKQAKEMLLTGNDRVTSQQAEAWGLVNRVVPESELRSRTEEIAMSIAENDQLAVRLTKIAINRSCEIAGMRKALEKALELDIQIETSETEDSLEFDRILKSQGTKAAIQWRNSKHLE